MAKKAPGKAHRKGLSLLEVADMFRNEDDARAWLEKQRWPDGPYCPTCGSFNVQCNSGSKTMTHRCRACPDKPFFSIRKGSVMENTKLPYRVWAIAIYLFTTNLKGVSSMKLHRELGISQKAAWHLLHRLREAARPGQCPFDGPVEVDESYFGGRRKNMPKKRRRQLTGRGPAGKTAVAGVKDRATNQVRVRVVPATDAATLQAFVRSTAKPGATVYTDEAKAYGGLKRDYGHEAVNHGVGEYIRGQAGVNGIEGFWSMLKRSYGGTFHKISPKHLDRYVQEFAARHNIRDDDTIDQMQTLAAAMVGKRLRYTDLVADNGLDNGARGYSRPSSTASQ